MDFDNEYKYSNTKALSKTISGDILVNVFPNPTKDHFNVQIEGINVVTELQIRDAIGKVVKSVFLKPLDGLTSEKIDMSEYAKGLYFLHFPMNKNIQTLRIVKN